MKRPSIKIALPLAFGLIAVTVIGFAVIAVHSMNTLNANSQELAVKWLPKVNISEQTNNDLSSMRRSYLTHIVDMDNEAVKAADDSVERAKTAFLEQTSQYDALANKDSERQGLNEVKAKFAYIIALGVSMMAPSRSAKKETLMRLRSADPARMPT